MLRDKTKCENIPWAQIWNYLSSVTEVMTYAGFTGMSGKYQER